MKSPKPHFVSPVLLLCLLSAIVPALADGPFQATGFKVGEVTDSSAIVWTRLTEREAPNPEDAPMAEFTYAKGEEGKKRGRIVALNYPDGKTARDIQFAAPGVEGEVRVSFLSSAVKTSWRGTDWVVVDASADYTRQIRLTELAPDTVYHLKVESRDADGAAGQTVTGGFRTAPAPDDTKAKVVFTVTTGQAFNDRDGPQGYDAYAAMLKLDPSFFVHTGDIVYYDRLAKTEALANWHWQRTYSLPSNVAFHRKVSSYFIKDDHETLTNDCWPSMKHNMFELTFEKGLEIFREQVPMGDSTYRTYRWGKDLQIWLVEGRDFRSPNTMPDGPEKTIWGEEQKAWFKRTVAESDATFRILISPTPVVGPDRDTKNDNHANKGFAHEGDEIREFIAKQKNMAVVCGDRHWQYMSVHPGTGVREYSCGPTSDKHAGGWNQSDYRKDYHRFLAVKGGFLSGTVSRESGAPSLTFRYHAVDGSVRFEDVLRAE